MSSYRRRAITRSLLYFPGMASVLLMATLFVGLNLYYAFTRPPSAPANAIVYEALFGLALVGWFFVYPLGLSREYLLIGHELVA